MRKMALLFLLVSVLLSTVACRHATKIFTPTENIAAYKVNTEEVRSAIFKACALLTWRPKDKDATTIVATISVRNKHTIVVEIPYTATSYSINYVSSTNMNATSAGEIHPNYNNWVIRLANIIDREIAHRNMGPSGFSAGDRPSMAPFWPFWF